MSTLITGNTYPVKGEIKALGGKWDPEAKGWRVPETRAAEAQALVAGAAPRRIAQRDGYSRGAHRRTGCSCGSRDGITQSTDCWGVASRLIKTRQSARANGCQLAGRPEIVELTDAQLAAWR